MKIKARNKLTNDCWDIEIESEMLGQVGTALLDLIGWIRAGVMKEQGVIPEETKGIWRLKKKNV